MATEKEVSTWLEEALNKATSDKNLADGEFSVKKSSGKKSAQFADHMFWWEISISKTEQSHPIRLRLNMFALVKNESPEGNTPEEIGYRLGERHSIVPSAQLVVLDSKKPSRIKGFSASKSELKYIPKYLSAPIEKPKGEDGDAAIKELFKTEFEKLLDAAHDESEDNDAETLLLTKQEWEDAKKESHRRNYIFSESPEGYEKAKKINEEGGDLELPNRDFLRLTPARYRIDTGTLNIHPPKDVLDKTLENLKKESNED